MLGLLWKGSVMTHACCPACRLRFTRAAAHHLAACPECGGDLARDAPAASTMGFRLAGPAAGADAALPVAVAVALPLPEGPETRR